MISINLILLLALVLCTLAFRFAGHRALLSTIDYRTIKDIPRFNRYVAVRMLFPTGVAACCAILAAIYPNLSLALIFPVPLAILGAVLWIGINSQSFSDCGK